MDFTKLSKDECTNIVWGLAMKGKSPTIQNALEMYANPNNWKQVHADNRCYWAWDGPDHRWL